MEPYIPDVVDFAYQIIDMQKTIERLEFELAHYKELNEIHLADLKQRDKHTAELTGIALNAILDPDSVINVGLNAINKVKLLTSK